jgi:hypothetical protein
MVLLAAVHEKTHVLVASIGMTFKLGFTETDELDSKVCGWGHIHKHRNHISLSLLAECGKQSD